MKYTCQASGCALEGMPFDAGGKCPRCGATRVQAKLEDPNLDIRGDRIEPDAMKDSNKLCFYKALARAQSVSPKPDWQDIINETLSLRSRYRVAFDEDAWAPALAEFYSFDEVAAGVAYGKVLEKCEDWHKLKSNRKPTYTTQYFVVARENADAGTNGHAIYVEYVDEKGKRSFKVVDNENASQTDRIAAKFVRSFFDIYGRTQDARDVSRGRKPEDKKTLLSEGVIGTLEHLQRNKT